MADAGAMGHLPRAAGAVKEKTHHTLLAGISVSGIDRGGSDIVAVADCRHQMVERQRAAAILDNKPREKRLDKDTKSAVIAAIENFDGRKDLNCLRSWLLYSGKEAPTLERLYKETMYNCLRRSPYPEAADYLDGLEITAESFETLLPKYTAQKNTLLILDPPYVCTQQGMYANQAYFGMIPFLTLTAMVRTPFIFFSSTRSDFLAYLDYLRQHRPQEWAKWEGFEHVKITGGISKTVRYEDNMIYRFTPEQASQKGLAAPLFPRYKSQAGIWIKREEFCAGFVMGDKGGGVTKKTQNRDKTPATLHHRRPVRIGIADCLCQP